MPDEDEEFGELTLDADEEWTAPEPVEAEADLDADPLAEFEDETRAFIEERERAAAERATAEALNKYRGSMGAWGQTAKEIEALGLVRDAGTGRLGIGDPARLAEAAARYGQGAPTPQALHDPAEADEPLDLYDGDKLEQQVNRRIERGIQAGIAPILEQLQMMNGYLGAQAMDPAAETARQVLEARGFAGVGETPEFREALKMALKDTPLAQRSDPATIRAATGMVLFSLPDEFLTAHRTGGGEAAPEPTRTTTLRTPNNLAQAGASRNGRGQSPAPRRAEASPEAQELSRVTREAGIEMDLDEAQAALAGNDAYRDFLDRRAKQRSGRR